MDKNSVTGLVLIALILGFFMWFSQPEEQKKAQEAQKGYQDSLNRVEMAEQKAIEEKAEIEKTNIDTIGVEENILQQQKVDKYGLFAHVVDGKQQFFTLENNLLKVTFSNKGAKVYSVELKEFTTFDNKPLILFDGDENVFGFNFFHNNRIFNTNNLFYSIDTEASNDSSLQFKLALGDEEYMSFSYTLPKASYMLDFNMEQKGIGNIIQSNRGGFDLDWKVDVIAQEKGRKFETQYSGIYFKYHEDEVDEITGKSGDEDIRTPLKWVAYKDQFFSSVFIAKDKFVAGNISAKVYDEEENKPFISTNKSSLVFADKGGDYKLDSFQFYFGPNHYKTLNKYKGLELKEMLPLGWGIFGWINKFIVIPIFNWLEGSIASYGLIILILTLIIKMVLFPLTYKSYISSAKMRVLKPQIDEINKKIPADKAMERQKATMALYNKAGVSPLGGCLPMLIQMPFLFAMFRFFPASIELRQESFLWAEDLSSYDSIFDLNFTIPFYGSHVSLFTLLMAITNLIYTRMNQEMTQSTSQMPGMKGMMYMMPIMFLFFFNNYSSGLSYYYFISTLITILQTILIRRFVDEEAILAKLKANQKKPRKKSGFQARIEEMAKQQHQIQKTQKRKK
jgi:YidC/Oxa1 family membrane protein insertase